MLTNLEITNKSKGRLPSLPFEQMKLSVLGKKYNLSLVFTTTKEILKLNKTYRDINKSTDILSFPLAKYSGEIFICPSETRKMMGEFGRTYENFLAFLFIHGLVHLKGYDHGPQMKKIEGKFHKKFGI
jgi:rRNA maturation RNase YbeY